MTVHVGKSVIASLAVALMAVWYMTSGVAPAQAGVIGAAGIAPAFAAANADQGHTLVGFRHGRGFGRHGGFRRFGGFGRHGGFGRRGGFRGFGHRGGFRRHGVFGPYGWHRGFRK